MENLPLECAFCNADTLNNQVIFDDGTSLVILPKKPVTLTHVMIIPKRHVLHIADLTTKEFASIQRLITKFLNIFKKDIGAEGYHILNNNGELADQHVPHVHIHVFFRSNDDTSPFDILSKKSSRQALTTLDWNDLLEKLRMLTQTI